MAGFEFSETMTGSFTTSAHPGPRLFEFSIHARAPSWTSYATSGRLEIDGQLYAPGLAECADLSGELVISPLRRRIAYRLRFLADDGRMCEFAGHKSVRLTHLMRSMTELPGVVRDESGQEIARCMTRFPLREQLLPFAASFRLA